jgi:hypothetical protein
VDVAHGQFTYRFGLQRAEATVISPGGIDAFVRRRAAIQVPLVLSRINIAWEKADTGVQDAIASLFNQEFINTLTTLCNDAVKSHKAGFWSSKSAETEIRHDRRHGLMDRGARPGHAEWRWARTPLLGPLPECPCGRRACSCHPGRYAGRAMAGDRAAAGHRGTAQPSRPL